MAPRTSYGYYTEGSTAKKIEFQAEKTRSKTGNSYQRGSAAPKIRPEEIPAPERKRKTEKISPRKQKELEKQSRRAKYRRMESDSMSPRYVLFLTLMVGVVAIFSIQYLNYQADIKSTKRHIAAMQTEIDVLASQNDAQAYDIEGYIDINRIINVATNELGMVRANESQVKYFEKKTDEFMNQYADVPEE